jgi:RNA polymerase sigma-70 factor (ECF subfamily)
MNSDTDEEFLAATLPHLDPVYRVAGRMTRDPGHAEDLVQETYVRAFTAFPSYRGGSIRAWLVTICLNLARSEGRRARRRPHEVPAPDAPAVAGPGDVADAVVASVERAAIARALARLPLEQRTCVVLVDLGGLTYREAADILGCPRGTVLARVHRGRRRVAGLLAQEGIHHGA